MHRPLPQSQLLTAKLSPGLEFSRLRNKNHLSDESDVDQTTLYVFLLTMVSHGPHFFFHQSLNKLLQHALSTTFPHSPISIVLLGLASANANDELYVLHLPQALA
jgi:hypothetical protein